MLVTTNFKQVALCFHLPALNQSLSGCLPPSSFPHALALALALGLAFVSLPFHRFCLFLRVSLLSAPGFLALCVSLILYLGQGSGTSPQPVLWPPQAAASLPASLRLLSVLSVCHCLIFSPALSSSVSFPVLFFLPSFECDLHSSLREGCRRQCPFNPEPRTLASTPCPA